MSDVRKCASCVLASEEVTFLMKYQAKINVPVKAALIKDAEPEYLKIS